MVGWRGSEGGFYQIIIRVSQPTITNTGNQKYMISLENNNTWFFFRVYGLHIKKNKNWRNFMFGDSTVANAEDIKSYVITKKFGHKVDPKMLKFQFPDNQSFIVVSITGFFSDATAKKIEEDAVKRANEIIGLIYFYFFYASSFRLAITLKNEIYQISGSSYCYYNSEGFSGMFNKYTNGELVTYMPTANYIYSAKELIKELTKPPYFNITKIIMNKQDRHFKEVSNSLVNFYKTSNIPSPVSQQLGSVTSIELLLKDSVKYDNIENRVKTLLGESSFTDFVEHKKDQLKRGDAAENEGVFEKRHQVIHDAAYCDSNDAFRAMSLYCMVLLGYCKICSRFVSKNEVCIYLDLIYKYKYHLDLKKVDTLKILEKYDKMKIAFDTIDWVTRALINFFGICNTDGVMNEINFIKTVYCLKRIRNLELKEAYKRVCLCIYYHKIPFRNFTEFEISYNNNINTELIKSLESTILLFKL